MEVRIVTPEQFKDTDLRNHECSTVWVDPHPPKGWDFNYPILGAVTFSHFVGGDYSGDSVFMLFAYGQWVHLFSVEALVIGTAGAAIVE